MPQAAACATAARPDWAVISITCVGDAPAPLQEGWRALLRIAFDDVDVAITEGDGRLFGASHAAAILAFADEVAPSVKGILVHCHAGISRSAAVAKFLAERLNAPFPDKYAVYNRRVYSTLNRQAWEAVYGPATV